MAKKPFVQILLDRSADVLKGMALLGDRRVLVGIPASTSMRKTGTITNAALGYIHENGAPEANIPARPFLKPAVAGMKGTIEKMLKRAGEYAAAGQPIEVENTLEALGMAARSEVMRKINSNIPPPLAKRTIAARKARGIRSERTLIRTGELRNSITYVVRSRLRNKDIKTGPSGGAVKK